MRKLSLQRMNRNEILIDRLYLHTQRCNLLTVIDIWSELSVRDVRTLLVYLNETDRYHILEKAIVCFKFTYENGENLIDDTQYDVILGKLKAHREEPVNVQMLVGKREVDTVHEYPKLRGSISKANFIYEKDRPDNSLLVSIEGYINTVIRDVGTRPLIRFLCSHKYDGVSGVLTLDENGNVIEAVTRGDEEEGASLLHLVKNRKFRNTFKCGLKVEIVMTKENYDKYCEEVNYQYANLRSAVVSIITSSDGATYSKYLSLVPLEYEAKPKYMNDDLNRLFATDVHFESELIEVYFNNGDIDAFDLMDFIQHVSEIRNDLNYAIDGIVMTIVDEDIVEKLGRKGSLNKYQIAYKFPSLVEKTIVRNVTYNLGRTGLVIPMIHYDLVNFNGTEHTKSSLSSFKRFKHLNLREGDEVLVSYNNDVMPYVFKDDTCVEGTGFKFKFTRNCPECKEGLVLDGANYFCQNFLCPGIFIFRAVHFYRILGIKNMGEGIITSLHDNGFMPEVYSILGWDEHIMNLLVNIDGIGRKKVDNIYTQILELKEKGITESILCEALGVSGTVTCNDILSAFPISDLLNMDNEEAMNNICELDVNVKELKAETFLNRLEKCMGEVVNIRELIKVIPTNPDEFIYKVCFSGFRDKKLKELLEMKGIKVIDSLKDIKYLVVINKEGNSDKIIKARQRQIPILTKQEFSDILYKEFGIGEIN